MKKKERCHNYCKWGYQDNFLFFLRKNLQHKKRKTSNFSLIKDFVHKKNLLFVVFYSLIFVLLVGFCMFCIFYAPGFFFKKIRNCPDNLIYYTTDLYPYQPVYQEFICTHLFIFVIICENLFYLWEPFLIFLVCENLFFKRAYECHHLK